MNDKAKYINDLELLSEILYTKSNTADETELNQNISLALKKYFKNNGYEILNFKIYIQDKINKTLVDFTKPWEINTGNPLNNKLDIDFTFFQNNEQEENILCPKVIINDYKILSHNDSYKEFKSKIKKTDNVMTTPLMSDKTVYGIIYISFSKMPQEASSINKNFLDYLNLSFTAISKIIKTHLYEKHLLRAINFHKTLQNITKIIETQYELNYIIPILGEMIDKFISQHLIYVFLKKDKKSEFELAWPLNCTDKKLCELLKKNSNIKTSIIENGGKIGIFPILVGEEETFGAIVAYNAFEKLTEEEISYLKELTSQASLTISKAKSYSKILQNATLDALTRLNNRHQFAHRLKQETATAKRQNTPLCCIMLDIDFFKKVNDTYGHAIGDLVLRTVSDVIKREIREYDIASRYGGEEFTILTPHTTLEEAVLVANRLREEIEKTKINIEDFKIEGVSEISVTISVGVSIYNKKKNKGLPETLYQEADKALYSAKESGRNRVVVFQDEK